MEKSNSERLSPIDQLIETQRVIICCGSGGVGKTTTSAALAIRAAIAGKNAVVITIDPAKRLATSLGLQSLSSSPLDLTQNLIEASNETKIKGSFSAVMPNTRQTFENFVRSMANGDEKLITRILKTSIFKIFAKEFSGANEYMAMEKLFDLYSQKKYDLIVLDTPPSANTRSFLDAPQTLSEFFDDKIIKWLISPGSKLLASGLKKLLEILEKLTGKGFISDLIDFASALFELRENFVHNLARVQKLLLSDQVRFVVVTSPERISKQDTKEFVELLNERGHPFWGFIINRVLSLRLGTQTEWMNLHTKAEIHSDPILQKALDYVRPTLEKEKELMTNSDELKKIKTSMIAEQHEDVHSISALLRLVEAWKN